MWEQSSCTWVLLLGPNTTVTWISVFERVLFRQLLQPTWIWIHGHHCSRPHNQKMDSEYTYVYFMFGFFYTVHIMIRQWQKPPHLGQCYQQNTIFDENVETTRNGQLMITRRQIYIKETTSLTRIHHKGTQGLRHIIRILVQKWFSIISQKGCLLTTPAKMWWRFVICSICPCKSGRPCWPSTRRGSTRAGGYPYM